MGKNEDLTDFKGGGGNGKFCRYKCFQCWCKGEKHENKQITIAKNQKLATQNFLFNMHINFPFGNI
jgi:hypothetical protein